MIEKKECIAVDPNNKLWANGIYLSLFICFNFLDQSAIGFKLLQKMGWSQGKGLGSKENGITDYLRVDQRQENKGSIIM